MREVEEKLRAEKAYQTGAQIPGSGDVGYGYAAREMTAGEQLAEMFTYQDGARKIPNYVAIRTAGKHLAEVILQNCPASADQSEAIRCVREACLWANAAVALDGSNL